MPAISAPTIPTNLISITDGQIVLDAKLFYEGQKPAVDVGVSVSRVGRQDPRARALRDAAKTVRLDYAQFLELEMFHALWWHAGHPGSPATDAWRANPRHSRSAAASPLRLADEVALVLAVQSGLLDLLPPPAVAEFRKGLMTRSTAARRMLSAQFRKPGCSTMPARAPCVRRCNATSRPSRRRRRRRSHDRAACGHQRADRRHSSTRALS